MERTELARIALEAARLATAVHGRHLGSLDESEWAEKGVADFVTRVDREAEAVALEHIRRHCPGHEIMAEESTDLGDRASIRRRLEEADHLWLVDPLDGTTNYLHGYPAYAASVAVVSGGVVVAGAVVDGTTGTAWRAWEGGGTWRNEERVGVSRIERLDRSLIGTGFPFKHVDRLPEYLAQLDVVLRRTSGVRRAGSAALDLCHVADGRFDGFWELWLAPWDVGAGTLLVREAGGIVTSLDGDPDVRAGGSIVAGNGPVHAGLMALLSEASARGGAPANPGPDGV